MVNALAHRERVAGGDMEMIDALQGAIHRAQQLVAGVLEYATASTSMEERADVDCSAVVRDVTHLLQARVAECEGQVHIADLPVIHANRDGVARIFQNLIQNALKFRSAAPPVVSVSATAADDGGWRFDVSDNGIGLPEGQLFEMFGRGAGAAQDGAGIGLAVCRRIVERHGGRIWGEPRPGGGSTFAFTLPES
jgi:signal transduction histidine kinase